MAKGTSITLSTSTPGAQIYYTLDGEQPCRQRQFLPASFTATGISR